MIGKLFHAHGEFCASHPWEVIVALLTVTACIISVDRNSISSSSDSTTTSSTVFTSRHRPCQGWRESCEGLEAEYNAADVILMTIVRCSAVLYCYYQFCSLHKLGCKYILGIAGLFTVFSSFIFTTSIIKFLGSDITDLKDAIFFLLLLIDLSNSGTLAQLALYGTNQAEVTRNIAKGMEILGPAISLDTIVETLVIGVGTLSGVQRLEILCTFAVMSVIVNYIVFMTFYPACLSLILDLTRNGVDMTLVKVKAKDSFLMKTLSEEEQKTNPVVQRVKVIMSTGLMIVHVYSRVAFSEKEYNPVDSVHPKLQTLNVPNNKTESQELSDLIIKWLTMSADQIVILILLIALVVKFIFFENRNEIRDQLMFVADNFHQEQKLKLQNQMQQNVTLSQNNQSQSQTLQTIPSSLSSSSLSLSPSSSSSSSSSLQSNKSFENKPITIPTIIRKKPLFKITEDTLINESTQTDDNIDCDKLDDNNDNKILCSKRNLPPRTLNECLEILNSDEGASNLTDDEIIQIVKFGAGHCPLYNIESVINHPERGVKIRRKIVSSQANLAEDTLSNLPYQDFDYTKVMNACCENVLGYVPIPIGYAGPLLLDGKRYYVPMATTEGALVASTNRGCKALSVRGVTSVVEDVGMTRAPCVRFLSVARAAEAKQWINSEENYKKIKLEFDSTSRFGRLKELLIAMDGPNLYIRFVALTGDAMGMNMVSKGAEMALKCIKREFPDMQIVSLSGNFCSDKKPAAINWIKGRGKRVVTECVIPAAILKTILKTDAKTLVECNKIKNMSGSALAGSIGGNNAHAANMVTAVFIATGQDPAQNVTSSNCSTGMEFCGINNEDLYMTCTMPSLEVGTVGGGTGLPGQSACLDLLGVRGANQSCPGENAKKLAQIICATVMAGELSLMAALVNNDLVKSHMRHNRSSVAAISALLSNTHNSSSSSLS